LKNEILYLLLAKTARVAKWLVRDTNHGAEVVGENTNNGGSGEEVVGETPTTEESSEDLQLKANS